MFYKEAFIMIIDYTKNGYTTADHNIEQDLLTNYRLSQDSQIRTSCELVVLVARALVAEGKMDRNKVEFKYEGESLGFLNDYGQLNNQPLGFCDTFDTYLDRLLEVQWSRKPIK
jgi:hypothetical protein